MKKWMSSLWHELQTQVRHLLSVLGGGASGPSHWHKWLPSVSFLGATIMVGTGLILTSRAPAYRYMPPPEEAFAVEASHPVEEPVEIIDLTQPVRDIPKRFPAKSRLPSAGEGATSVSIGSVPFDPDLDLVEVYDDRAWWESEHDRGDTEDDHLVHTALEIPLRRLIELVSAEGGVLKVQDSYRDAGIHSSRSLHKQGRAIDLTCDELGLSRLAALTWAAGFDWVYYEAPKKGGHHVHASVRPDTPH